MLWLTFEALAQLRILRRNTHRAGVEVTLAHHDATSCNQWCGGKTELVRSQQGTDDNVAPGAKAAIHLDSDPSAQVVEHQGLVGFRKANFPWRSGVLDGRQGGRPGAAFKARDRHMVGPRFGNASGNSADTNLGNQFNAHIPIWIDVLQIVDQLGQIFDGVDVMVRGRGDQSDTRS